MLIDGLWYSAIGQWTPGLAFPDGLPNTPDYSLGLHWPALRSAEADGRQADDEACGAPPCRFVHYGRPETREEIARVANTLSTSGVDSVEIPDVPDQWATPLAESMSASGLDLTVTTHVPQRGAYTQKLRAVGPASSPPCVHPTSVEQDECRALLTREEPPTALPPPSKDSLIRTAWSLSTGWHHGLSHRLDPGPVHVAGLAPGLARQWATIIAMAGGLYLLGDPVDQLTDQAAETFWAPWEAGLVRLWRPVYRGLQLPTVWRTPGGLALFNWGDEPATMRGLPGLLNEAAEVRSLFDERSFPEGLPDTLDVPPQDVIVLFIPE